MLAAGHRAPPRDYGRLDLPRGLLPSQLTEEELAALLRQRGILERGGIASVILITTGSISVRPGGARPEGAAAVTTRQQKVERRRVGQERRQVIAFVGDGGLAMLMSEFLTAVRQELPVKVVVNNNNADGQILWKWMVLRYPEYAVRHQEPEADSGAWATACGGFGAKVTEPGEVMPAIRALLARPGPGIVDCSVKPDEPSMPGNVSYEQAKHFAQAVLRGQPHNASMMATIARDKRNELVS